VRNLREAYETTLRGPEEKTGRTINIVRKDISQGIILKRIRRSKERGLAYIARRLAGDLRRVNEIGNIRF
jgi:hypothetical protein